VDKPIFLKTLKKYFPNYFLFFKNPFLKISDFNIRHFKLYFISLHITTNMKNKKVLKKIKSPKRLTNRMKAELAKRYSLFIPREEFKALTDEQKDYVRLLNLFQT